MHMSYVKLIFQNSTYEAVQHYFPSHCPIIVCGHIALCPLVL